MANQIDVGSIIGETVELIVASKLEVLLFTGTIGAITAAGAVMGLTDTASGMISYGVSVSANSGLAGRLLDLVIAIGTIVGAYWLIKVFLRGRNLVVNDQNRFWHYLAMSILAGLATMVGLLLLLIPGIILIVRWSAASGYLVSGREGVTESLQASWAATRGNAMSIFLAGLVVIVVMSIAIGIVTAIFGFVSFATGQVVGAFLETAVNAVLPAFGIAVYCLLEDNREQLDQVFA